jgi:hypothetical protein
MHKALWVLLLTAALTSACTVTVPSPDLSIFGDLAGGDDLGTTDPGTDPGEDPGRDLPGADHTPPGDPGVPDDSPVDTFVDTFVDTGWDPGIVDTGTDLNETPQPGNSTCITNQGCLSGECRHGTCTCKSTRQCNDGQWCDGSSGTTVGTDRCQELRQLFAGCSAHEQCASGACDTTIGTPGYCAKCANGGTGCDTGWFCCGGTCSQGCLGCALAPPPAPEYTFCMSGCFDAATQFCGPQGPEAKREIGTECWYSDAWCKTGYCKVYSEGAFSYCACRTDEDCGGGGALCLDGGCAIP